MKRYGYHRTSTREQHLDRGITEITAYCEQNQLELERIFTDQQTGKNFNRPRYQVLKEDVLFVYVCLHAAVPGGGRDRRGRRRRTGKHSSAILPGQLSEKDKDVGKGIPLYRRPRIHKFSMYALCGVFEIDFFYYIYLYSCIAAWLAGFIIGSRAFCLLMLYVFCRFICSV